MAGEFSRWGMTMRTPAGAVDLVPLFRRLEGDKTTEVVDHERDAAILALTHLGVAVHLIHAALKTSSYDVVRAVLAKHGMKPVMATQPDAVAWTGVAQTSSAQRRARRLAERIEVDGRLIHEDAPHGTNLAYTEFGCRCEPCTGAHAAKLRSDRDKKRMEVAA